MTTSTDPARRGAVAPERAQDGPVTLINSFVVPEGREAAFHALWTTTSSYFRGQPGFVSLRLHRALTPNAQYRFINVANWVSGAAFNAPHATLEFRTLVSDPQWREFPSTPALYEVMTDVVR